MRIHPATGEAVFRWEQDRSHWQRTAMLLEPFLAGRTGHQYLTREGKDAALVEFSFGESAFA